MGWTETWTKRFFHLNYSIITHSLMPRDVSNERNYHEMEHYGIPRGHHCLFRTQMDSNHLRIEWHSNWIEFNLNANDSIWHKIHSWLDCCWVPHENLNAFSHQMRLFYVPSSICSARPINGLRSFELHWWTVNSEIGRYLFVSTNKFTVLLVVNIFID